MKWVNFIDWVSGFLTNQKVYLTFNLENVNMIKLDVTDNVNDNIGDNFG